MSGRVLLTLSAIVLFGCGVGALFAADEVAHWSGATEVALIEVVVQMTGAGMLALAFLDWTSRKARIGGVYARPLGLANLTFFTCSALSVDRILLSGRLLPEVLVAGVGLTLLAAAFGWLVFLSDPLAGEDRNSRQ